MNTYRTHLFIASSSVALIILLGIQVNWMVQTAKTKEALFTEKANIVLSRTTEAIGTDEETCKTIEGCLDAGNKLPATAKLGKHEIRKIDSLFRHYMRFYNFYIDYTFEVIKPITPLHQHRNSFSNYTYYKPYETSGVKKFELKLLLPDKKQFILAEMGSLFITSVILIIIVFVLFLKTVISLIKEKEISEHTTDFLNNMTHEFKTPLTNITLAGKMISHEPLFQQDPKLIKYTSIILEENEKLRLQVEQVLSMTALERGEIPLNKTPINLHSVIETALRSMKIQLEHAGATIDLHLEAQQQLVLADQAHLTNAVCNLIDNAIKYAQTTPALTIETRDTSTGIQLLFSDAGIGISKTYHSKVFDKFFRVPTGDVHDVKGFGLGLAYIKKIITLHGGSIVLRSEKGTGTQFTITLPNV